MGEARADTVGDVPPGASAARLTRGVARGERAAVESLYCEWFDRVYRMARAATKRDESFCLDVVQDVMMRAVKSMRAMDGERELRAWMGKATISCAIDAMRKEQRRARRDRRAGGGSPAPADGRQDRNETDERVEWLRGELARMDEADRALLLMRFGRGSTLDEAGEAAGVSGDAAHGRLRRLMRALARSATEMLP